MERQPREPTGFALLDAPPVAARANRASARRADLLLGLLLLLAVIGGAWWGWRQQQQVAAYNTGKRYAAAHLWDKARDAYYTAGDYGAAAALARQAAALTAKRDRLYATAAAAVERGEWVQALQDLQELQGIQPNYGDSTTFYRTAENQIYRFAVAGAVALRPAVTPAGLYLHTDQGWVWLPGSDAASQVYRYRPGDCWVYDAPGVRASPDTTAANPNLFATSVLSIDLAPAPRHWMFARVAGQGVSSALLTGGLTAGDARQPAGPGARECNGAGMPQATAASSPRSGATLRAYIAGGNLWVGTEDGKVDLLVEQDVLRLYGSTP